MENPELLEGMQSVVEEHQALPDSPGMRVQLDIQELGARTVPQDNAVLQVHPEPLARKAMMAWLECREGAETWDCPAPTLLTVRAHHVRITSTVLWRRLATTEASEESRRFIRHTSEPPPLPTMNQCQSIAVI